MIKNLRTMTKIDFSKVEMPTIDGGKVIADFRQQLGNQLYMTGNDIEACELGKRIYFSDGEMELSEKEVSIIKNMTATWSYIARTTLANLLDK